MGAAKSDVTVMAAMSARTSRFRQASTKPSFRPAGGTASVASRPPSGRTRTSAARTARNDTALMPKTRPAPASAIRAPPMPGPMTRARLYWAEFSAIAFTIDSRGTSVGTNACHVGPCSAIPRPMPNVMASTIGAVAAPVVTSTVSAAACTIIQLCAMSRSRLRETRSARSPPMGESTSGMKLAKLTSPTQKAEFVRTSTYQERATFCIHVPVLDSSAPVQSNR